jgi:hypothetical protein
MLSFLIVDRIVVAVGTGNLKSIARNAAATLALKSLVDVEAQG